VQGGPRGCTRISHFLPYTKVESDKMLLVSCDSQQQGRWRTRGVRMLPETSRPAASEVHDEGVFVVAGVVGRDNGDGDDGTCACGSSRAHAAMSCSRSSCKLGDFLK
jgi:hypothetical protein